MFRLSGMFNQLPLHARSAALLLSFITVLLVPALPSASAHPLSVSNTNLLVAPDYVELVFSIDDLSVIESVAGIDGNRDEGLDAAELEPNQVAVTAWVSRNLTLQAGGTDLTGQPGSVSIVAKSGKRMVVTTIRYAKPETVRSVSFQDGLYIDGGGTTYVNLLVVRSNDRVAEKALSGDNRTASFTFDERGIHMGGGSQEQGASTADQNGASGNVKMSHSGSSAETADSAESIGMATPASGSSDSSWRSFFLLGIHHILTGYDHLLFLLALLLRRQPLSGYVKIATAFTIAHSLTLTLAVLGWNPLPSRAVEILIALSIVYVAAENLWDKNRGRRWQLAFAFGLVHGLGFAGILSEMDIPKSHLATSLISFNLGIEVVQIGLIVLASPLLTFFQTSRMYRNGIAVGSAAIIGVGGFWVVERMM